jgi:hypothetical protein
MKQWNLKHPFNLTPQNICDNSYLKSFYKLSANSLFGKLEQKSNRTKTKFVTSQNELEDIFFSNDEIESIICLNENCCQIEIKPNNLKQTTKSTSKLLYWRSIDSLCKTKNL